MSVFRNKFYGVTEYSQPYLSDQLEMNCQYFFDWCFLQMGAYENITTPLSGIYGGDFSRLRPVRDPNYNNGEVWEGARRNWVWETGIDRNTQPIRVSGVFINGNFQPVTGVGPYAHSIDYWNGRVIFDSAISTNSVVTCEYTYRYVNTYPANMVDEFKKMLQTNSFRVDDVHFLEFGSGSWNPHSRQRLQLPAIIVESIPKVTRAGGVSHGSNQQWTDQEMVWHIFANNNYDVKQLHDILTYQNDTAFQLFDKQSVIDNGQLGLNFNGSPNTGALMYPDLKVAHGWKAATFHRVWSGGSKFAEQPLIYCPINATIRVRVP